jgi:hypothetical protein
MIIPKPFLDAICRNLAQPICQPIFHKDGDYLSGAPAVALQTFDPVSVIHTTFPQNVRLKIPPRSGRIRRSFKFHAVGHQSFGILSVPFALQRTRSSDFREVFTRNWHKTQITEVVNQDPPGGRPRPRRLFFLPFADIAILIPILLRIAVSRSRFKPPAAASALCWHVACVERGVLLHHRNTWCTLHRLSVVIERQSQRVLIMKGAPEGFRPGVR